MKKIKIYQVDAFTSNPFHGNPAAVCLLDEWISDGLMQAIAAENNLAETAFVVPQGKDFEIRWFTPTIEVDLCGHATLATAFVLFHIHLYDAPVIRFHSPHSGLLKVMRHNDILYLDFPTDTLRQANHAREEIARCIGVQPLEVYKGKTDHVAVIDGEFALRKLQPDLDAISRLKSRGLIVTAKGKDVDFVSRFFAPQSGIPEDQVTGSAHTSLTPLWSGKLNKEKLSALQLSSRGGQLECEYKGERCLIGGQASLYLVGEIYI